MKTRVSIMMVVILCLVLGMTATAFTAPVTDIGNHWAKEQINAWVGKGLVSGYEDGTFRPGNNITRAEFMALVNRAFNYQAKAEIDFEDVKEDAWYTDVVKIAKAAGYISGYQDGTMRPNNPISRQEAAIIIMKILGLDENTSGADNFKDVAGIPSWSKGAVGAVTSAGIMGGYPDGTFKAANLIKRAEAVVALDKALNSKVDVVKEDVIYDKAGTYGPSTGLKEINGNVIIAAANVTLQNTVIKGDLTIDKAVGDGDVHLKQVTVKGDTYIYGGGKDSIYFIDSQTGRTYVLKDDGPVRIVVSGTTEINELIAQSGVTVEEVDLTGEGIEGITVDKKVDGKIEINLKGVNVESLEVNTPGVTVRADRNTAIGKLVVNAKTDFRGSGNIKYAYINASGVTFEKMPEDYEVAEGVKPPTIWPSRGGGGGGGSSKEASTYKFSYQVPAGVVAGTGVAVPVTFATGVKGDYGYDGVRFKFAAQGPGNVTFKAKDSNGVEHTFTNKGYWGPAGGFNLPAEYSATTDWTLVFSAAGEYTITFSLIDAATEQVIAGITGSVTVEVGAAPEEPAVIASPGVSPEPGIIEGDVAFTFGFKSVTGNLQELDLDIYLGENTGEGRNYAGHIGINLPAGSYAVSSWVDGVVGGYEDLDEKYRTILAAAGYDTSASEEANKAALKENIFYEGDAKAGTWTIKLNTAVLGEEAIEFLVTVIDDQGAQWGNNSYVAYPDEVKAFLYNVTLPVFNVISNVLEATIKVSEKTE